MLWRKFKRNLKIVEVSIDMHCNPIILNNKKKQCYIFQWKVAIST